MKQIDIGVKRLLNLNRDALLGDTVKRHLILILLFSFSNSLGLAHHSVLTQKTSETQALFEKVNQMSSGFQCVDAQILAQKDKAVQNFLQSRDQWLALNATLPTLEDRAHLDDQIRSLNEGMVVFIFGGTHFIGAFLGSFVYLTEVDSPSLELRQLKANSKDAGLVRKQIIDLVRTLPKPEVTMTLNALFTDLKNNFDILSKELETMRKNTETPVGRNHLLRPWINSRSSSLDYQIQATLISYHANVQTLMSDILSALQENCSR